MFKRLAGLLAVCMYVPLLAFAGNAALAQTKARDDIGTVQSIEIFRAAEENPVNAGSVIGGVAGGVIGHQIGSGRGNTAATVIGALGGAAIGNEIHKKQAQVSRYRITVLLDSGSSLIVDDTHDANLRVGDRVRVENDRVYRL